MKPHVNVITTLALKHKKHHIQFQIRTFQPNKVQIYAHFSWVYAIQINTEFCKQGRNIYFSLLLADKFRIDKGHISILLRIILVDYSKNAYDKLSIVYIFFRTYLEISVCTFYVYIFHPFSYFWHSAKYTKTKNSFETWRINNFCIPESFDSESVYLLTQYKKITTKTRYIS